MGNTQGLESSGKVSSVKDDSPMPLRDELEEQFAQLVVIAWCLCTCKFSDYLCTCTVACRGGAVLIITIIYTLHE